MFATLCSKPADSVRRRPSAEGHPDSEADEGVAHHPEGDGRDEVETALRVPDAQRRGPDRAAAERVLPGDKDNRCGHRGADEVAGIDEDPVPQQSHRRDLAAGPSHDDEGVAGEQLGAADDHEDEPQAEGHPSEQPDHAKWKAPAPGAHRGREDRAEGDEGTCEDGQRERADGIEIGLADAHSLGLRRHLGREESIEPEIVAGHGLIMAHRRAQGESRSAGGWRGRRLI